MSQVTNRQSELSVRSFREQADEKSVGLGRELVDLLLTNKKWWLAPIVGALLIVGVVVLLGGTAAAPFIYTLF
ncbi:MAG: hypothetical protein IT438_14350 [Phycisphaerales bacterium]|nr:hypothetical protein [Phycisphaerales bacterium]